MGEQPDAVLNAVEKVVPVDLLREAAMKGWVADFDKGQPVAKLAATQIHGYLEKKPAITIDAADIREVLLGLAQAAAHGSSPLARVSAVRLYNVTVTNVLELDDEAGPGGSQLPRLEFTKCWFEAKQIRLERCRLRSLRLRGCVFSELQASEAVIGGPVDLSYVRASGADKEDPAKCWVVLAGAQIDGRINGARSTFVAPKARDKDHWVLYSKHSRYALDLRSTRIRGSINLRPDMKATGGVCLTLAKVEGSIWANGAQMDAVEECSFAADYAEIQGSLFFRPYDGPEEGQKEKGVPRAERKQFISNGCMGFLAIKVGGSIYFEGARLTAKHWLPRDPKEVNKVVRWEETSVVNLSTSVINGHCVFRGWISEPAASDKETNFADASKIWDFVGDGDILLSAAVIRNDLYFEGARVRRIHAQNIEVFGTCNFGTYSNPKVEHPKPFVAWNSVTFAGGRIRGNLQMDGARIGCRPDEGTIDLSKIDRTVSLIDEDGKVTSVHERALNKRVGQTTQAVPIGGDEENGFLAAGLTVGGFCSMATFESDKGVHVFRFECAGKVSLEDAKIGNYFCMDGARVVCLKGVAINLAGSVIGGKVSFRIKKGLRGLQVGKGFRFSAWGGDTAVRLNGAKIAFGLNMNGAFLKGARLALAADNIDVGGRVSLGTFEIEVAKEEPTLDRFTSMGKVSLVGAMIKLQLNLSGARLHRGESHEPTREDSGVMDALDLTLAHTKGIRMGKHSCRNDRRSEDEKKFKADGRVVLNHATVDTDLILEGCILTRQLSCDFAKVGGSLHLSEMTMTRKYEGWSLLNPSNSLEYEGFEDERVFKKNFVQRRLTADISLNGLNAVGSLKVGSRVTQPSKEPEGEPKALSAGDLESEKKLMLEKSLYTKFVVDLRGATIGELDDLGGRAWDGNLRFWLEGFRYRRLKEAIIFYTVPTALPLREKAWRAIRAVWNPAAIPAQKRTGWQHRAGWLQQQYLEGKRPSDDEPENGNYPDAYEQAIARLKAAGSFEDAKKISSIHLSNSGSDSRFSRNLIWLPFQILFNYGYSLGRALVTFLICIGIGMGGASWAARQGVLVPIELGASASKAPSPKCETIGRALYVIRVFVPVLEAKADSGCAVAGSVEPNSPWRMAETFYRAVGWIITPMVILTASGIFKRHLER